MVQVRKLSRSGFAKIEVNNIDYTRRNSRFAVCSCWYSRFLKQLAPTLDKCYTVCYTLNYE